MNSRRLAKMAEAIREVVSMAILTELKDPRVSDVTVTGVEVSADLRLATVKVSVMGDETKQRLCLYGLESSAGFLQRRVADRIETRYTPHVRFVLDQGVKKALEINRILQEVLPKPAPIAAEEDFAEEDLAEEDLAEEENVAEAEDHDDDLADDTGATTKSDPTETPT